MTAQSQVHVLADDAITRQLIDVNPTTGDGTVVAELASFDTVVDLTPTGTGELYALYTFSIPAIVRVDPANGAKTILWRSDPMGPFITPRRLDRGSGGHLVFIDDGTSGSVLNEVDEITGVLTPRPVPMSLGLPTDLVVEPNGDVIVFDEFSLTGLPTLVRINQITGAATTIARGGYLSSPTGMGASLALDGLGGLYVLFPDRLIHVDVASGAQRQVTFGGFLSSFAGPSGRIDVDATGVPIVFVSGAIVWVDPTFGTQVPITSGGLIGGGAFFVDPGGVVVSGASIFVGLSGSGGMSGPTIAEVIASNGGQRAVDERFMGFVNDVAIGPTGEVFISGDGVILGVDPTSGAVRTVTSAGFLSFFSNDVTVDPVSGDLYVASMLAADGAIIRVDPTTGSQYPVASGGLITSGAMNGLDMNMQGQIFLLSFVGPSVTAIRVDVTTGTQTLLPFGGLLFSPIDLTIGENGDLFILESTGEIIRKNATTGVETLIPTGPFSSMLDRITASDTTIFVLQSSIDPAERVIAIDPGTGDATPLAANNLVSFGSDIDVQCVPEPRLVSALMVGLLMMSWLSRARRPSTRSSIVRN